MSTGDINLNTNGFSDFDLDFGFDFSDTQPKEKKQNGVIRDFATGVWNGMSASVKTTGHAEQILKGLLPESYSPGIDTVVKARQLSKALYDNTLSGTKEGVRELRFAVRDVLPEYNDKIPKRILDKLDKWANEQDPESYYSSFSGDTGEPIDREERSIQDTLFETFKSGNALDNQRHAELLANMQAVSVKQRERDIESLRVLAAMQRDTARIAAYNDQIDAVYKKKSLEFQLRSYKLQVAQAKQADSYYKMMQQGIKDLIRNSSLTDYQKATGDKPGKQRGLFGRAVSGAGKSISDNILNQSGDAIYKGNNLLMSLASGLRGMAQAKRATNMSGMSKSESAGMFLGQLLASNAPTLLRYLVAPQVSKIKGVDKVGDNLSYYINNSGGLLNQFLKSRTYLKEGWEGDTSKLKWWQQIQRNFINPFINNQMDKLPVIYGNRTKVKQQNIKDLNAPAQYDNLSRKTLVEIIPGLITRTNTLLEQIYTKRDNVDPMVFNHKQGKFTRSKENAKDLKSTIFRNSDFQSTGSAFNNIIDLLDPNKELSAKARTQLMMQLARDVDAGNAFDVGRLTSGSGYGHGVGKAESAELAKFMRDRFKTRRVNGKTRIGNGADIAKLRTTVSEHLRNAGQYMPDVEQSLNTLLDTGQRSTLKEMGIIRKVNGRDEFNHDMYWEMMQQYFENPGSNPYMDDEKRGGRGFNGGPSAKDRRPKGWDPKKNSKFKSFHSANAAGTTYSNAAAHEDEVVDRIVRATEESSKSIVTTITKAMDKRATTGTGIARVPGAGLASIPHSGKLSRMSGAVAEDADFEDIVGDLVGGSAGVGSSAFDKFDFSKGNFGSVADDTSKATIFHLLARVFGKGSRALPWALNGALKKSKAGFNAVKFTVSGKLEGLEKDLYKKGKDKPLLRYHDMTQGEYYSAGTGQQIHNYADVTDAVVDNQGNLIASKEDLRDLVTNDGEDIKLPVETNESIPTSVKEVKEKITRFQKGVQAIRKSLGLIHNEKEDIYVGGEETPRIYGKGLKEGRYFDGKTHKPITRISQLTFNVIDGETGEPVLTPADKDKQLFTTSGKKINLKRNLLLKKVGWIGLNLATFGYAAAWKRTERNKFSIPWALKKAKDKLTGDDKYLSYEDYRAKAMGRQSDEDEALREQQEFHAEGRRRAMEQIQAELRAKGLGPDGKPLSGSGMLALPAPHPGTGLMVHPSTGKVMSPGTGLMALPNVGSSPSSKMLALEYKSQLASHTTGTGVAPYGAREGEFLGGSKTNPAMNGSAALRLADKSNRYLSSAINDIDAGKGLRTDSGADRYKAISGDTKVLLNILEEVRKPNKATEDDVDGDGFRDNSWKAKFFGHHDEKEGAKSDEAGKPEKEKKPKSIFGLLGGIFTAITGAITAVKEHGILGALSKFLKLDWLTKFGKILTSPIKWLGEIIIKAIGMSKGSDALDDAGDILDDVDTDHEGKKGKKGKKGKAGKRSKTKIKGKGKWGKLGKIGSKLGLVEDAAGKTGMLGKIFKGGKSFIKTGIGKANAALTIGMGAYDMYDAYQEGDMRGVATAAGSTAGAALGGSIGAALGSFIPVFGTVIGGMAGSYLGGMAGEWLAGKGYDAITGTTTLDAKNPNDIQSMRMRQYGMSELNEDDIRKMYTLETALDKYVEVTQDGFATLQPRIKMDTLIKAFGIDPNDEDAVRSVITWFNLRFKPIYLTHRAMAAQIFKLKTVLNDTSNVKPNMLLEYAKRVNIYDEGSDHPYRVTSQFLDDQSTLDYDQTAAYTSDYIKKFTDDAKGSGDGITASNDFKGAGDSGYSSRSWVMGTKVKDDVLKAIDPSGKGIDGIGTKGHKESSFFGGETTVVNTGDLLASVMPKPGAPLDDFTSLRMKSYGMGQPTYTEVSALMQLELVCRNKVDYGNGGASFKGDAGEIFNLMKATFNYGYASDSAKKDWVTWFNKRFLPVFLSFSNNVKKSANSDNPLIGVKSMKANDVYQMALEIRGLRTTNSDGKDCAIWDIEQYGFSDKNANTDSASIYDALSNLQIKAKDGDALKENKGNKTDGSGGGSWSPQAGDQSWYQDKTTGLWLKKANTSSGGSDGSNHVQTTYNAATNSVGKAYGGGVGASVDTSTGGGAVRSPARGPGSQRGTLETIKAALAAGITDPTEIAMFLAQTGEESGDYSRTEENLHYSASGLQSTWPNRFGNPEYAKQVAAAGPAGVANAVYGGRMGNTDPGDGYKYRGRGFLQVTGKDNYARLSQILGVNVLKNPDYVASPEGAAASAAAYWMKINGQVHKTALSGNFTAVSNLVNTGSANRPAKHAGERQARFNYWKKQVDNGELAKLINKAKGLPDDVSKADAISDSTQTPNEASNSGLATQQQAVADANAAAGQPSGQQQPTLAGTPAGSVASSMPSAGADTSSAFPGAGGTSPQAGAVGARVNGYGNLKLKSPEAVGGGKVHPGLLKLAELIQSKVPNFKYFSALNDEYHHKVSGNSKHKLGLALDFGLTNDAAGANTAMAVVEQIMKSANMRAGEYYILNEFATKTAHTTGGHIHVDLRTNACADKFLRNSGGAANIDVSTVGADSNTTAGQQPVADNNAAGTVNTVSPAASVSSAGGTASPSYNDYGGAGSSGNNVSAGTGDNEGTGYLKNIDTNISQLVQLMGTFFKTLGPALKDKASSEAKDDQGDPKVPFRPGTNAPVNSARGVDLSRRYTQ